MSDWRSKVLQAFTPQVARLTIAADPDGLLVEEGVLQGIRQRGFEPIQFEDHVEFRYVFEAKFRSRWDRGEQMDLVVVLRAATSDFNHLPYDLVHAGRKLSLTLAELFPNLSYSVVAALERSDLDALYQAQQQQNPGKLGDNATKDFVLRHVFEIAPELIKRPTDLLRVLLRRHHADQRVPRMLDERFIEVLRRGDSFADWPLEQIVPDGEAFFAFLQERWPHYLDGLAGGGVHETTLAYAFALSGPADVPFGHDDVRVYVDTLFLEGLLQPVAHPQSEVLAKQWVAVGVQTDPQSDRQRRLRGLMKSMQESLPAEDARHHDWLVFAYRWAELLVLWVDNAPQLPDALAEQFIELRQRVDAGFEEWVLRRYAGLHNQPAVPPVMIHHVARHLCRQREKDGDGKVALVVLDGLAIDQWIVLRDAIQEKRPDFGFQENAVFAWVPTVTSVSRQAAFAGKLPLYFPASIHDTDRDGAQWTKFWEDHGLVKAQVAYMRGIGNGDLGKVTEFLSHPSLRAMGIVVNKVDKIMHGMQLGMRGMHNQVRQWGEQAYLARLLDLLIDHGFTVTLGSDHGNLEAMGCGRPAEGVVADKRGERVRVYPEESLRKSVHQRYPKAMAWPSIGLPDDYLPLLAPERLAFVTEGDKTVAHGGISIEEVIVPLIQVERGTR